MRQFWDLKKLKMLLFNRSSLTYRLRDTNFYSAIRVAVIIKVLCSTLVLAWCISVYERHRTNFICLLFLKPKVCFWGSNANSNCLTNKAKSEKILRFLNWTLLLDSGSFMLSPFNLTILSRLFRHQYVNCYVYYPLSPCTHAHFRHQGADSG